MAAQRPQLQLHCSSYYYFFIFTCLLCNINICVCCPQHHKQALLQFKSFILIESPSDLDSWVPNSDCCLWKRVNCSTLLSSRPVERLHLSFISNNSTAAAAMTPLFQIRSLTYLDLSSNGMYGEIPTNGFLNLTSLVHLQYLDLSRNSLSGNLSSSAVGHLLSLKVLNLSYNHLIGEIPKEMGNLSQVQALDLSGNHLIGEIPKEMGNLAQLKELNLNYNHLIGEIPKEMGNLAQLKELYLNHNDFSGGIPASFGNLSNLVLLNLGDNRITGGIPKSFLYLRELQILDLRNNSLSLDIPVEIGNLLNLTQLDLGQNELTGGIPSSLGNLSNLIALYLDNNKLSGPIPVELFEIEHLKSLYLEGTKLNLNITPKFSLGNLSLRSCGIIGNFPNWLSNQKDLHMLDLSENKLEGTIPQWLLDLDIPDIDLSTNKLTGRGVQVNWKSTFRLLPSKTLSMYSLLDLSRNHLSGEIPLSLGRLKGLKSLNVSYNELSGKIPTSFGEITNLENLDLSHNKLSGVIPETFKNLHQLSKLDVSNNELEGQIPMGDQMDTMNDPKSYANNKGLCGTQIHIPCHTMRPPSYKGKEVKEKKKEPWFLWEGAWVGYLVGFFWTVLVFYYFNFFGQRPPRHCLCN